MGNAMHNEYKFSTGDVNIARSLGDYLVACGSNFSCLGLAPPITRYHFTAFLTHDSYEIVRLMLKLGLPTLSVSDKVEQAPQAERDSFIKPPPMWGADKD